MPPKLEFLFNPRSIAIAGVSDGSNALNSGQMYLSTLMEFGFNGKIYPVNPAGGEVSGLTIYPSITDIPGEVDFVISAIPARYAPQLVADCVAKGVRAIQFFTSGFSEIEDERGKQLESEIVSLARQGGTRIVGPNCLGLCCPRTGLSFSKDLPKRSGNVGLFAQSGGNSVYCISEGSIRGICFSKIVSYGNAADLNECDFLEYLAHDPDTEIIIAYIEGVKDGVRFAKLLREATRVKPVIILKAGVTEYGAKAADSHTSSVAGSRQVWHDLLRQAGVIQVHSIVELVDVALAFSRVSHPWGRNTAVLGIGGGASVLSADDFAEAGLVLPALPKEIRQKLRDICGGDAGAIFMNPVDLSFPAKLEIAAKTIAAWDQIDLLIVQLPFELYGLVSRKIKESMIMAAVDSMIKIGALVEKPYTIVLHSYAAEWARQLAYEMQGKLVEAGFAVYPSIGRAASAISRVIQYYEWRCQSEHGNG